MRGRFNSSVTKRIEALEGKGFAMCTIAHWPKILGIDEWEALAVPQQEKLRFETQNDELEIAKFYEENRRENSY